MFINIGGEIIYDFKLFQLLTHEVQRLSQLFFPGNLFISDLCIRLDQIS
jgi:hypothetical protein